MAKLPEMRIFNCFVDEIIPKIKPSSWTILSIIIRKTVGWQKEWDAISFTQFRKLSGLALASISKAIKELENLKFIQVCRPNKGRNKINKYSFTKSAWFIEREKQFVKSTIETIMPEKTSKIGDYTCSQPQKKPSETEGFKTEKPSETEGFKTEKPSETECTIISNKEYINFNKPIICEKTHIYKTAESEERKGDSSEDHGGKPENRESYNSGVEVANSSDLMVNKAIWCSNGFSPPDSEKNRGVKFWGKIENQIKNGEELNCNQATAIFKKKYDKLGLGNYVVLKSHRKKMKEFLLKLGTYKILLIIDFYITNYVKIHKRLNINGKPSIDVMLSAYLNDFIGEAIKENVRVKKIDPNNLGIPERFRDVVTAAGSW